MDMSSSQTDWNSSDEFFEFTRGRFIVDEAENLRKREITFDLNSLAKVAADLVGAARCIAIKKYPDGMFNKAFLMSMKDGQEVIAKIPNPIAGIPHFTTASEVATMDFRPEILDTTAPRIYTWNSQAKTHPVGAEFIKLQVLLALIRLQKQWLSVSFSHYSSLYYTEDVQPPSGSHFIKDGMIVRDSEFAIGPDTGRDWCDAGRSNLDVEKGPFANLAHRMFEYGETHFQSLLVDLKDTWTDLPAITSNTPFPFDFSEADFERIKLDSNNVVAGTELVAEVKERMGDLWPGKGFIEHERYYWSSLLKLTKKRLSTSAIGHLIDFYRIEEIA
ncbi:hypothetical protein BDV06DRAFT_229316 [Aspergillus oleicola]